MSMLDAIVEDNGAEPRFAMIWLHGLGADGNDFASMAHELPLPPEVSMRFVFPHAPVVPVTINGGYRMRAWYDISHMDLAQEPDMAGIAKSADSVVELMRHLEHQGIPLSSQILCGFSQGGVIALHIAAHLQETPLAVVALSTYAPTVTGNRKLPGLPIFFGHGEMDSVVPVALGQQAYSTFLEMGTQAEMHRYPMPHSVCSQEIDDLTVWLANVTRKV